MTEEQYLDELYEAVDKDVNSALEKFSSEDLRAFVRDFAALCTTYSKNRVDVEAEPVRAAAYSLFLAKLFPLAFRASYHHTDKMMKAEDSIRKALEDL